jgi:chromosome segregation ATPase
MQNKYVKNVVSKLIALTFVGSLAPSVGLAAADSDALYDSRAELESAEANLGEAQSGYDMSVEELQVAKGNHSNTIEKNVAEASRIRAEIARLQKEQSANNWEAKNLASQAANSAKEAKKNEAAEKRAQKAAAAAGAQLDKAQAAYDKSQSKKEQSAQAYNDTKEKLAQAQQLLKAKNKELAIAKSAEQRSVTALKNAQAQYAKVKVQGAQEMKRMNQQLKLSLAKTAQNEKNAQVYKTKKQQIEASLKQKRQRLGQSKGKAKQLARVSAN